MVYPLLKWLHVLLAITAVGVNLTYGIWLTRAARSPEVLPFTLRGIRILDSRIANPAYALLLVTGLGMVVVGDLELSTPWLAISLVLYVAAVLLGLLGYTPTLRNQIRLVDEGKGSTAEYADLSRRGTILGIVLGVIVVAIVYFMVVKPGV